MPRNSTTLKVDGYEISATFAETRNTAISGHLKQILLASFANSSPKSGSGDILVMPPSRGIIRMVVDTMYLENYIDCVLIRIFILAH